jgi:diketogulonate reductase-like aldo/keto reductase
MKSLTDTYTLHNGIEIPVVGFGTWQTPNDEIGYNAVLEALKVGYRHIDTAAAYKNEESVGRAIKDSGVKREDIFLTTKVWNGDHGYEATLKAFEESIKKLGTTYLDLYLIHWPNPLAFRDHWREANAGTWQAMEELYEAGKIKAIGISNFRPHHIDALLETAKIVPMVNQIRLCPGDIHHETVNYCVEKNILLEAYSPLGTGKVFEVKALQELAEKYKVSIAKLCLRWSLEKGFLPLPKSVTPERIASNADLFDFAISLEDVELMAGLIGCAGEQRDPDTAPF